MTLDSFYAPAEFAEEADPAAPSDSLAAEETDWLLDSLAVMIDPLTGVEGLEGDVPDISDSLAAATEARVPTVEEIFDYPVTINRRVLTWIDLYLGKARRSYENSLRRSGRYLAMARRIFAEEGVPQDLVFLAHVESGFRYNARSPARALGLWQFMRGTARLYDLRCDAYVDERLDPEKSTRASARYLHDLYEEFDDWCLALAAYNAGSGKVSRAIRRSGTRDFWRIAQTRFLVNETRNFVPAVLAATILAKSPGAYGLTEETELPLAYETVLVDSPTDLRIVSRCTGATLPEVQRLNPALLLLQTPFAAEHYEIRVPLGVGDTFARRIAAIPRDERLVYHRHVVCRNQTLGLLARRYGTTVRAIQDANQMGRSTLIRTGRTLLVPSRHVSDAALNQLVWAGQDRVRHTVARGETVSGIAGRYGVSVRTIRNANALRDPHRIAIGQVLEIPIPKPPEPQAAVLAAPAPEQASSSGGVESAGDAVSEPDASRLLPPRATRMLACNTSHTLGRVHSTAHIVEQARAAIEEELERERAARAAQPQVRQHEVRRGDTLSQIARRYGVRTRQLRRWNALDNSDLIRPGQQLLVCAPESVPGEGEPRDVHVVKRGDSLWEIAQRYGVRTGDLARWNRIGRTATIYPGQKLLVY